MVSFVGECSNFMQSSSPFSLNIIVLLHLNSLWGVKSTFNDCLQVFCNLCWRCLVNNVQRSSTAHHYSMYTSSLIYTHDTDENSSQMTSTLGRVRGSSLFQSQSWCSELHDSSPWYLWEKQTLRCCKEVFLYVPVLFYYIFLVQ